MSTQGEPSLYWNDNPSGRSFGGWAIGGHVERLVLIAQAYSCRVREGLRHAGHYIAHGGHGLPLAHP